MVRTFEITNGVAHETGHAQDLAQASARLPHGGYTTLRTYGGDGVVRLAEHLRRLEEAISAPVGRAPLDEARVRAGLAAVVRAGGYPESRIRLTWAPPHLHAAVEPFEPLPAALYETGVACLSLPVRRQNPHAKDTRFLETARAAYASLPPGRHEGLLVGDDGTLLEGLSSNFFAVREGILHTEDQRVLPGLTRAMVLEVARSLMPLATTAVRIDQLRELSEAFITSASRGVLPVVRVDDAAIGTGRPGPVIRELRRRFDEQVAREVEPLGPGPD
jgi:branched-chain amino acid aminotransferase